jgi:WD40 repeat protein/tRNA A-37 threonylcarbamoyl transferase component Bud32
MTTTPNNDDSHSLSSAQRIDAICDRFELAWIRGERISIDKILEDSPATLRHALARELVAIEMELRRKAGEEPSLAQYAKYSSEEWLLGLRSRGESANVGSNDATLDVPGTVPTAGEAMDQKDSPQKVLKYFGDYELMDVIAQGGMGIVYKARQMNLNRIVALKMILSGEFASKEEVERFYSEAKAAALLDHPGIVPIYEVGEHEGKQFFSMTHVEGVSLASKLNDGPLEPIQAARIILEVAQAVHYAHEQGVIHRDLKPSNILLDLKGRPRITDFGLAKRLTEDKGMTVSGQVLGTPSYMPPEQAAGQINTIGPASDVYALGAVLYSLTTGRPPFQSASSIETLRQVVEKEPVSPRQLNPAIPRDLETIVLKCLEKSLPRRYQTAKELVEELQRFIEGRPILARPIGRVSKAWRWCRRQPMAASLMATVALTMLVATIVSANYARRESKANTALGVVHKEGLNQLAKAYASEANARRMSGRPGQRFGALRAIRESMKITGPTRELADVASAALCLPDCEVDFEWNGYPEGVLRLALSPQFDCYARSNEAGVISIRSLPEDREIFTIEAQRSHDDYGGLRFSDDGRFLFETYRKPYLSRVWLLTGEQPRLVCEEESVWAETLDGRNILIAQGNNLLVVDSTGQSRNRLIPVGQDIRGSFFGGRFGQPTVSLNMGQRWKSVDTRSDQVSTTFFEDGGLAAWPAYHPNGHWAVWTSNSKQSASLFEIESGKQIAPKFSGHKMAGIVPFISRHGDVAFSNDWSGMLRMWDPRSGYPLFSRPSVNPNNWLVVSKDNQLIGPELAGNNVRWLRFATGREFGRLAPSIQTNDPVVNCDAYAISRDGRLLAFGCKSGLVLCDTSSGLPLVRIADRKFDEDHVIGFIDDGSLLTVESHRIVRRRLIQRDDGVLHIGPPEIDHLKSTSTGVLVRASCSRNGQILVIPKAKLGAWYYGADALDKKRLAPDSDIRNVSVSPNGQYVTAGLHTADAGKASKCAYVWDTLTGKLVQELDTRSVCSVAFSPNGRYLTTMSSEVNECRIFEVDSWKPLNKFVSKYPGVFSPDESLFAIGTNPGEISLRRSSDLSEFAKLSSPDEDAYRPLVFTPDNSRLYACNMETQRMCVWNLALIRSGLAKLDLAANWPLISLESTPDIAPLSLKVTVESENSVSRKSQQPSRPTGIDMVDQVRKAGWIIALSLIPKLETADEERFPGIRQFAADVRRIEKSIEPKKPPHEWSAIAVDQLLHRNPNFWRAMYEMAPGDPTISILHIGLLIASGEIDQAHNLLHLLAHDTEIPKLERDLLLHAGGDLRLIFPSVTENLLSDGRLVGSLDLRVHYLLSNNAPRVKQGNKLHDAKDYDGAITAYEAALAIWPQNAAAQYELGYTKSVSKTGDSAPYFAICRRLDPLRFEAYQGTFEPGIFQSIQRTLMLWKQSLYMKERANDDILVSFAKSCQSAASAEIRLHELALVARQIIVARHGRYDSQDREFIARSLRELVPDVATEETLKWLAQESVPWIVLIPRESKPCIPDCRELLTLTGHTQMVTNAAFRPDGTRIASVGFDKSVKVWDIKSGKLVQNLNGPPAGVMGVVYSQDGKRLATGSGDGTVKGWDAVSGQELFTAKGNPGLLVDIEFAADGERLATAGSDSSVRLRDARSGQETNKWIHSGVKCLTFSPDGEWLASGGGPSKKPGEVKLWDATTGKELLTLKGHTASVHRVVYRPDSRQLASASGEFGQPAEVKIWDAASGQELLSLKGHNDMIKSMMFSPDGKLLATRCLDRSIRLWDATTGQELFTWKGYSFISMVFSSDSKGLISASDNGLIRLWDLAK